MSGRDDSSGAAAVWSERGAGAYGLATPLTFATVPGVRERGLALIGAAEAGLAIDLGAVPQVDSAGLALLVDWLAVARARGAQLRYTSASTELLALARLSEVESLITGSA